MSTEGADSTTGGSSPMFAPSTFHTQTQSTQGLETARWRQLGTGSHLSTRQLFDHLQRARDHHERDWVFRELIDLHAPIVERVACPYRHQDEPYDDLRHVATVGLIQAIREFTPERGRPFLCYAMPNMTDEVRRYLRHHRRAVGVPLAYLENRTALTRAAAAFEQHHGRSPTVSEIAEMLDITIDETVELIDASSAYSALSLDVPYGADEEETTLGDTLGDEDYLLETVADRTALRPALETLSPRDRRIVLLRFAGDKTQAQIAEQVGLSQMHVSRRLSAALAQLRAQLNPDV
jgi:RNA polymerase sigma-B factor